MTENEAKMEKFCEDLKRLNASLDGEKARQRSIRQKWMRALRHQANQ